MDRITENENENRTPTRQVSEPCPRCGSYYRIGDYCNVKDCGQFAPVAPEHTAEFSRAGREAKGRVWDPKKRKYVLPNG